MTILYINTGSSANKGDGDTLRTAFNKINRNFEYVGPIVDAVLSGGVAEIQAGQGISINSPTGIVTISATTATSSSLGGVKIGDGINIQDGVISVAFPPTPDLTTLVNGTYTFILSSTGVLIFPDQSIQTTAYTGTLTAVSTFVNDVNYLTSSTVNDFVNSFTVTNVSYFNNDVNYLTSSTLNQYVNATIIESDVAPVPANTSTLWYDTVSGRSYVYYLGTGTGVWVDAAPEIGYVLAVASTSTLGGVKIGANFIVAPDGTISVNPPPGPKGDTGTTSTITIGTVTASPDTVAVNNVGDQWNAIFDFTLQQGPRGDTGTTSTITIGTVSVSTDTVSVINVGDQWNPVLDFTLQQGPIGLTGDTGTAATISIGTVTSGTTAAVTNVGDQNNAIFDFVLQQGQTGDTGTAATINIGTVSVSTDTVAVSNTGTSSDVWLNFILRQGDTGPQGPIGNTGTQGVKGDTGTSIARSINYVIDGGGLAISTGTKGYLVLDFNGTLTSWTILGDTVGSIVVDVKRSTYANFPATTSITGTGKPTLINGQKNQNTSMSGWTSSTIYAGDILEFYVNSANTATRVTLDLKIIPTQ